MEKFKIGDVVRLKHSNCPNMTVESIGMNKIVGCIWFNAMDELKSGEFHPICLRKIKVKWQSSLKDN